MKRLMDMALSFMALLLLSPLLLLAALVIGFDSGFPVFFRQTRIGKNGREFYMYKFRSMVRNAPGLGPHFTANNDPRITRAGRWIRRTSIDELPQLINVLRGDMSLVGPRPHVPAERSLYTAAEWESRCSVLPGITGLAQISGRSDISFEQQCALDQQYVQENSCWLDIRILWGTVRQLGGKHAN